MLNSSIRNCRLDPNFIWQSETLHIQGKSLKNVTNMWNVIRLNTLFPIPVMHTNTKTYFSNFISGICARQKLAENTIDTATKLTKQAYYYKIKGQQSCLAKPLTLSVAKTDLTILIVSFLQKYTWWNCLLIRSQTTTLFQILGKLLLYF